jgi:hypothetical protein
MPLGKRIAKITIFYREARTILEFELFRNQLRSTLLQKKRGRLYTLFCTVPTFSSAWVTSLYPFRLNLLLAPCYSYVSSAAGSY